MDGDAAEPTRFAGAIGVKLIGPKAKRFLLLDPGLARVERLIGAFGSGNVGRAAENHAIRDGGAFERGSVNRACLAFFPFGDLGFDGVLVA